MHVDIAGLGDRVLSETTFCTGLVQAVNVNRLRYLGECVSRWLPVACRREMAVRVCARVYVPAFASVYVLACVLIHEWQYHYRYRRAIDGDTQGDTDQSTRLQWR